jgi:hypothetical protein
MYDHKDEFDEKFYDKEIKKEKARQASIDNKRNSWKKIVKSGKKIPLSDL